MSEKMRERRVVFGLSTLLLLVWATIRFGIVPVEAARISDVRGTKHNLSAAADGSTYTRGQGGTGTVPGTGTIPGTQLTPRNIKASTETQVCVFCHTPHGATQVQAPLWNRAVAGTGYTQNYIMYDSSTLDAKQVQGTMNQPGGSSKLCLSCHDGTMAIGSVNVLNGQGSGTPGTKTITTTGGPNMPTGLGVNTGFTRNLGTDLSNDHPISISYNATLASADGELRTPDGSLVGARSQGVVPRPKLPLENTGVAAGLSAANDAQIQCITCHDPHVLETDYGTVGNQKFLRLNRFQEKNPPSTTGFDSTTATAGAAQGDIICLACHDKNNGLGTWAYSVHANPDVGDELYSDTAADRREFRRGIKVWQAACLNCHDTHTVYGARRLLREGTNEGTLSPKAGGTDTAALEETCYQCHDGGTNGTLTSTINVPNIKTDFGLSTHMPITNAAQGGSGVTKEVHDISSTVSDQTATAGTYFINCTGNAQCGKDFVESRSKLGVGALANRHVECTDCHNPHRVIRAQNGLPGALTASNTKDTVSGRTTGLATHKHPASTDTTTVHSNTISGVLRGSWGVEPTYSSNSFHSMPSGYDVKRGDPGSNTGTVASSTYVTREYQICMKCHSDYGYTDNNTYPAGNRPTLGYLGGTPSTTNNLTMYTNQAKEFQAPSSHASEPLNLGTDAGSSDTNFNNNNHRSWHPVMAPTGRTTAKRGMTAGNPWLSPWNNTNAVGAQTMYCTDCHGSAITASQTVVPADGNPWGPHGSGNNFILKGVWSNGMGATGQNSGETANLLCFKCHDSANYTTRNDTGQKSGFYDGNSGKGNLHNYHIDRIQKLYCVWCHVAVPHGWKNKALLVNLNDVGQEAGMGAGTSKEVAIDSNGTYYKKEPYYLYSKLKVASFAPSGNWADTNCGSRSKSGTNLITSNGSGGTTADAGSGASTSNTTGTGKNWMISTCSSPTN